MRELRHLISRPTNTEELLTSQQDAPTTMPPPIHISSTIASASTSHLQHTVLIQPPTPPPTFSGLTSEKPLHFLVKLQQYTEAMYGWNTDTLLRNISDYLLATAFEWYTQLRISSSVPHNWSDFQRKFIQQFTSPLRSAQARQQWDQCRQKTEEPINEFIVRLRTLWYEQKPEENESHLVKHVYEKMTPEVLLLVGVHENISLNHLMTKAQQAEQLIFQRKKQAVDAKPATTPSSSLSAPQ
ncbi:unnamed protein product [Didymodactylos carnosus]|uniref:Retrotransposon gag domain-containing protein n=1 Tax=Didymodactylos carnosus TaxID=1234261 RepID=A0A8S2I4V9_9BILA|nr:unnamed protein product [Didymodactylos carnosus]CAF3692198.1 unnamed protein product [Didymodactylos carnosus]